MKKHCVNCMYHSLPYTDSTYQENETIFLDGHPLKYAYIIRKGLVKISKIFASGEERIFDILGPKDFIALVAVLKGNKEYIATATALTEITVGVIHETDVLEAYQTNNAFKDICMSCAMTRTNLFQSQLSNASQNVMEDKILSVLEYLTKKFGAYQNNQYTLELPFSKTVLANIIGIRRETLSRKLSSMQKANVLQIEKNKYYFSRM